MGSLAMLTKGICAALVALGIALSGSVVAAAAPGDLVDFTDASLQRCVNDAIGQTPDAAVTELALSALTELSCPSSSITTLDGIEVATNLTSLRLGTNRVDDLTPIAGLTSLKRLVIDDNAVTDISALRNLHNLELLHLNGNSLTSLEPLSHLTQLTDLRLGNNQLRDLSGLESLPRVRTLYLGGNQISDLTPLSGATSLVDLRAWNNQISDLTPLAPLANLSVLHLNQNEIREITPLSDLSKLTDLRLPDNQVSDLTPIINLTSLSTLMIDDNLISDLSPVQGLTRLEWFTLASNSVTDLSPLRNLAQLSTLHIDKNQVTDISPLSALARLQNIWMGYNLISDLTPVTALTDLKWLGAGHNRIEDITPLRDFPRLKRLELNHNKIEDISPLTSLTSLETLLLEANSLVDISAARSLPLLKWFTFNNQRVIGEPVAAGSVVPNLIRQFTTSHVTPTDATLCTAVSCESLVYPTVGADVALDWSEHVIIGSGHGTFSGRLVREVTAPQPSREDLIISLGHHTAQYEMGAPLPSGTDEWLELFEGSQVSTDPTATLEPVSVDVSLFDAEAAGEYSITFSVRDSLGRHANTTGKVVVRDTTAPTLKAKASPLTVTPGVFNPASVEDWITAFGVSVSDAGSGVPVEDSITLVSIPSDLSTPGSHTVIFRATDNADNTAEVSAQLVLKRPGAPKLSLGNRRVIHEMGEEPPASAEDWIKLFRAEATSLLSKQQLPIRVDMKTVDFSTPSVSGHKITFSTTDLTGAPSSTTGVLIVADTTRPQLELQHRSLTLPETAFEKPWSTKAWLTAVGASATDHGGTGVNPESWQVDLPKELSPDTDHRVQISVSDNEGNTSMRANVRLTLQAAPTSDPVNYRIAQSSEIVLDPIGATVTTGTLAPLQPFQVSSPTAGGKVWIEDERVVYAPAPGFVGTETLEVQVVDNLDQQTAVHYSFDVVARPALSAAPTPAFESAVGQPTAITHESVLSQVSGSQLRVSGVSIGRGFRGKVAIQDQELVYTPDGTAWAGRQSFSVTVQDEVNQSVEVPVLLDVVAPQPQTSAGTFFPKTTTPRKRDSNLTVNDAQQLGFKKQQSPKSIEARDNLTTDTVSGRLSFTTVEAWLLVGLTAAGIILMLRAGRKRQKLKLAKHVS